MIAGEILEDFATMMAEPNLNRFTQKDRIRFLNRACRQLSYSVDFPEATFLYDFVNGSTEFALNEVMRILRVYLVTADGQKLLLPGTTISELEGDKNQTYNHGGSYVAGHTNYSPEWIAQPAKLYPWANMYQGNNFNGVTGAWHGGDRARYYLRGGNIGVVPAPITYTVTNPDGSTTLWPKLQVDTVPSPPIVTRDNDILPFPDWMGEALVFKMCEYARRADGDQSYTDDRNSYEDFVSRKGRQWQEKLQGTRPKTYAPVPKRTYIPGRDIR